MIKNRVFAILINFFVIETMANAITIDKALLGISEEVVEELMESKEVFRLDRQSEGFKLLPNIPMTQKLIERTNDLQPDVLTEGLYIIPYSEGIDKINIEVYNIARRVSSLSGLTYLSSRKKAVVPLFENVYAIYDLRRKKPIEDPLTDSIPASDKILLHMREVNFGRAYYQIEYNWDGESLGFFMENLSNLRSVLKFVGKRQMQVTLLIMSTDEGFLVYGSSAVKLSNSEMVFSVMDPYTGFYRRTYAIVIWIYNELHNTNRIPDFGEPLKM